MDVKEENKDINLELLRLQGQIDTLQAAHEALKELLLSRGTPEERVPLSEDEAETLKRQVEEIEANRKRLIEYRNEYAKKKYKRLAIFVSPEKQEEIKKAAADAHESINGFVTAAIDMRLETIKLND